VVIFSYKKVVIVMTEIGKNIMARRKELGLTQEELATKMGYKSKSTINKIELGRNDIPQSKIVAFANALETTPAYLMGWEKVQKENDTITDAVLRMTTDHDFFEVVETLYSLDSEKIAGVKQLLSAFLK
jgi:transcriptional regulator with XRE-family HTH domain